MNNLYNYNKNDNAFLSIQLELYPTEDQKEKIKEYIIVTNYLYDIIIDWMNDLYIKYMNDEIDFKYLSRFDCNSMIKELRKTDELANSIPLHIATEVFVRASYAFKAYLEKRSNYPIKHYPNNITNSFSIDLGNSFYIKDGYLTLPGFADKSSFGKRVGKIKCQNNGLNTFSDKIYNGSIYIDNMNNYYFYYTYQVERIEFNYLKTNSIGIDLGYRLDGSNTIVCSDGSIYGIPDITHLDSRIKYFQSLYDKEENIKKKNEYLLKFQNAIKKLYNVLNTFYDQATIDIIKKNPEAIVIEDSFASELKRKSKNNFINYGYIASGKIRSMILYKANLHKIPVYIASKNFKSSYICSRCYHINIKDLKCKKIFICENCGYCIDRDLNASINLNNIFRFRNSFVNYNNYIKDIIM